jgi:hypothetical protein
MSQKSLESFLDLVEQQLSEVSLVLAEGNAAELQSTCEALQATMVQWGPFVTASGPEASKVAGLKARIYRVSTGFDSLRKTMFRRTASVEQGLHTLVPATQEATYLREKGVTLSSPYGRGPRASGAFRAVAV